MRKNIRAIATYCVIALLCVAAFGAFLSTNGGLFRPAANMSAGVPAAAQVSTAPATFKAAADNATPFPDANPSDPFARADGEEHAAALMKTAAGMPASHRVGLAQGEAYDAAVRLAAKNAGGLNDIVKPGSTVLIKPNLIRGKPSGSPICTDWHVMQAIADMAWECGAARVVVAEASPFGNVYKAAEYDKITGVELIDMNECKKEDCYLLKPEKSLTGKALYIPRVYMDADIVIGAAKLKTHQDPDALVSLGLKLAMGIPPTSLYGGASGKIYLHSYGLKESIVDLNRIRRPDMMFIDGIVAGEGFGPHTNTPVQANIVFAGSDMVALDTVALTYMGFTVDEILHVKLASDEGLGISDLSKIEIVGADLDSIKTRFKRPFE